MIFIDIPSIKRISEPMFDYPRVPGLIIMRPSWPQPHLFTILKQNGFALRRDRLVHDRT